MNRNDGKPTSEWTDDEKASFDEAIDAAEYGKCIEISTQSAIKEMVAPGMVAILTPVAVGFGGGATMLGGVLAGVTASGVLLALFQSNAGGAWDNAKKWWRKDMKSMELHMAKVQKFIKQPWSEILSETLSRTHPARL